MNEVNTVTNDDERELRRKLIEFVSGMQTGALSHRSVTDGIMSLIHTHDKQLLSRVESEVIGNLETYETNTYDTLKTERNMLRTEQLIRLNALTNNLSSEKEDSDE